MKMNKEEVIKSWESFCEKNEFKLNPDKEVVELVAEGVLDNEKEKGLKYCPCRLPTGDFDKDLELICPCNFEIQKTWTEKGECWCSLFVKK